MSDEVKAAGGLAIIGTERHESRRVDRQLRGRAGRQGDPGSSVFFVSLELPHISGKSKWNFHQISCIPKQVQTQNGRIRMES